MSGPQVYFKLPNWPTAPAPIPAALPPPIKERSFRSPFGIDKDLFNAALRPELPVLFATTYIVAVFALNAYNRKRGNQTWWIAKQSWFYYFVVTHNALLTLYSAATFAAMCRAIIHTWPGLNTSMGLAGVADSLCKMHGPRGLGDAATFNTTINIWEVKNTAIKLGYDGNPDPTDVGRLWTEGLAFWGWMFYVSKFYEVLDTAIIIVKGKRSATLQTYHHSGAMLCMWAGIRYMSPPIWMFVFVNSFIHALMYTYFTLSALGFRVPPVMKRTLTSMQIAQFLWGASYAAAHLFVQYDIPIATPYRIASTLKSAVSSASSAASEATSTISSIIATPTAFAWGAFAKKLLLRGLGEEGIAERVSTSRGKPVFQQMEDKIHKFQESHDPIYETRWRTDYTKVNCIDTSGEAFAIYLNLLYLAPLTFLFARFFVKAYTSRGKARTPSQAAQKTIQSGKEAEKKTEERIEQAGARLEKELENVDSKDIKEQLRKDVQALKDGTWGRDRKVSDHVQDLERQVKSAASKAKAKAEKITNGSGNPRKASPAKKTNGGDGAGGDGDDGRWFKGDVDTAVAPKKSREALHAPSASGEKASKQEDVLAASQDLRPGTDIEGTGGESTASLPQSGTQSYASAASLEDTDAMGKSGAIVDFVDEKVEKVADNAKELAKSKKR